MGLLYFYLYLYFCTYCSHPRISIGPALGRMGLYSIRVCNHPITSHVPLLCRVNTTVIRCSTVFFMCRQCNNLVLLCLSFTACSYCCAGLVGWFRVTALRLTRRSACPQGARHFVFFMSGIELA
jgi:hypothetical protein